MASLAGIRVWPVIKVSCDFLAFDKGTLIMLLIALMSPLELVKTWVQLTASVKCQICMCASLPLLW